jgi:hypothetical protein
MEGREKPYADKYMEILGEQNYDFNMGLTEFWALDLCYTDCTLSTEQQM